MPLHRLASSVTCVVLLVTHATAADPSVAKKPVGWRPTTLDEFAALAKEGPRPPWMPFLGQNRVADVRKDGTVVSVGPDGVELQIPGQKGTVKYPPHELLATGAVCHWETDRWCYLLDDVKKGDLVTVGVGVVDKERGEECFYICILKRPGEEVPASRKPSSVKPYHKRKQSENEIEEKKNSQSKESK